VGDGDQAISNALAIAVQFNGKRWAPEPIPFTAGATYLRLQGVSCASATICTAVGTVGSRNQSSGGEFTLADRWNGAKWVLLSTVNATAEIYRGFDAVSCPTASYCVAVGNDTSSTGMNTTLSEVLRGTKWSLKAPPATRGGLFRDLYGVSCQTTTDCVAVGFYDTVKQLYVSVADQWNGATWARQATPSPSGARYSELFGVSCPTVTSCAAVGTGLALNE
jgi:hypothetical protein